MQWVEHRPKVREIIVACHREQREVEKSGLVEGRYVVEGRVPGEGRDLKGQQNDSKKCKTEADYETQSQRGKPVKCEFDVIEKEDEQDVEEKRCVLERAPGSDEKDRQELNASDKTVEVLIQSCRPGAAEEQKGPD